MKPANSNIQPSEQPVALASEEWPGSASRTGRHLAMVLALGIVFLGVASLIKPNPRGASASTNRPAVVQNAPSNVLGALAAQPHPLKWRLIGMLEGKKYLVLIHASPTEPRYSVFALDGKLLERDLRADDVYRSFPDLELNTLITEPAPQGASKTSEGPLMIADPAPESTQR